MDALPCLARARGKDGGERAVIQDRIFSELYDGKIADLYEELFPRKRAREECSLKGRCCAKRTTCFQSLGKSNRPTPVRSR
jgi:hypothetical protein